MKIVIMHAREGQDGHFTLGGARLALFLGGALMTAAIFGAALQRYITPILPAVHTVGWPLSEQPGRDADFLRGNMFAPKGTPEATVKKLTQAFNTVLADPDVKKKLEEAGFEIVASNGPALDAYVKAEYDRWSKFIKSSNINLDN